MQRANIDQQIQPPLVSDAQPLDDNEPFISKEINQLDDLSSPNAIISLPSNQSSLDHDNSQISKFQAFSEFLIVYLNRTYDLRPREGSGRPPKIRIINEPHIKTPETLTAILQPLNQIVETSQIGKIILTTFNFEKALERVKIPIPLAEL